MKRIHNITKVLERYAGMLFLHYNVREVATKVAYAADKYYKRR